MKIRSKTRPGSHSAAQSGYMLLAIMIMATVGAILAAAALPRVGQEIRREREEELIHRGTEYARAIRKFYKKNGRYPLRLEELENTNNIKYLRKRYRDPITGSDQWRIIHFGEAKVTPHMFGNQPVGSGTPGSPATGGTSSGTSTPPSGTTPSTPGQPLPTSTNGPPPTTPGTGATPTNPNPSGTQPGTTPTASTTGTQSGASGTSQTSGPTGPTFGGAPIVGVSSTSERESLKELNGKNHYNQWEFVYDPRFDPSNRQAGGVQIGTPQTGQPGQQTPPGTTPPTTTPTMPQPSVPR
jgi:type II secretory pathway pseudopilin PulG